MPRSVASQCKLGRAHLLGHLIGIDAGDSRHLRGILNDPQQIRNRAFHAAAQIFRRVSASSGSPIMLQLEDLQWADGESLDFLNYLVEVNRDVPMLILSFTRPTLFERRTDWEAADGIHQRIDLEPLDKTGSRLLANESLKKLPEVPVALHEMIVGGSEGNPFYMEELLKMLIEQGAIHTHGRAAAGHACRFIEHAVPST
jgi:predicted ATPase